MSILVFGSVNVDHVMRVRRISRPGETNLASGVQTYFGGKGANQAIAAARLSATDQVNMVGAIGNDAVANGVLDNFAQNRVGVANIARVQGQTGTAYIMVDPEGENAITVVSGANEAVSARAVKDEVLVRTTYLILQLEIGIQQVRDMAVRYKILNEKGCVVLNLAPVPRLESVAYLKTLLDVVDLLIVNEHEAMGTLALLGKSVPKTDEETMRQLAETCSAGVVITLGAGGSIAQKVGQTSTIRVPSSKIDVIDTTGAGDTFVGALVAKMHVGLDFSTALSDASKAAALACTKFGAQAGMPTSHALSAMISA